MKRNDPQFKEMVSRLQSGELTRKEAAEIYGVGYGTLCVWLARSKANDAIPKTEPGGRQLYGAAVEWAITDPDKAKAVDQAVQQVLKGEISALAASKIDPRLSSRTIAQRVRRERLRQGLPVQHRSSRYAST